MRAEKIRALWTALPLLWVAFGLGVLGLSADGIWYDEWATIYRAGGAQWGPLSPAGIVDRALEIDPYQSIGYFLAAAGWGRLVGWEDVPMRAFSLLAGLPVVALMYRTAWAMRGGRAALFVGLVGAASNFIVYYLHEMRPYAPMLTFAALAVYAYWRIIDTGRIARWNGAALTLGVAGMLYTQYSSVFLIGATGLYHLLVAPKRRAWWLGVAGCMVLSVVLFSPWLWVLVSALRDAVNTGGRPEIALSYTELAALVPYLTANGWLWLWLPVLAGTVLGLARPTDRRARRALVFVVFVTLVSFGVVLLAQALTQTISHHRYLLALMVPLTLWVGLSLDQLADWPPRTWGGAAVAYAVAALWFASGIAASANPGFQSRVESEAYAFIYRPRLRMDRVGEVLQAQAASEDAVLFSTPNNPWAVKGALDYYLQGIPARYVLLAELGQDSYDQYSFIGGATRVWIGYDLLPGQQNPPLATFRGRVEGDYLRCGQVLTAETVRLDLYAADEICCAPAAEPRLSYDQPLSLNDYAVSVNADTSALQPLLAWAAAGLPPNTYSALLYLTNAAGDIPVQVDVPIPSDPFVCQRAALPLAAVPPGDYTLNAVVYAWETGARATASNGSQAGQVYTLAEINVLAGGQVLVEADLRPAAP